MFEIPKFQISVFEFQISVFPNFKHLANTLEILKNALGTILRIPTVRRQLAVREGKLPSRRANCLEMTGNSTDLETVV